MEQECFCDNWNFVEKRGGMKLLEISIIIVNFKTYKKTKNTIESILGKEHGFEYEIILIDNNSNDNSIGFLENDFEKEIKRGVVKIMKNDKNLGFSKANNQGIRIAQGKYILLLNSDTIVVDDVIEKSVKYMAGDSNIGVLSCRVELEDGKLDRPCKRGFPTPQASLYYMLKLDKFFPGSKRFGQYNLTYLSEWDANEVDCVVGAFMLIPRKVIDEVGMLDEDFFMYGEDIDWCYRIKNAGYKVVYNPNLGKIIHYKGASGKKRRFPTIYEFHRAMYLFYKKHYKSEYSFVITWMVYIGIFVKGSISLIANLFKRSK